MNARRRKPRDYPKPIQHVNESGKADTGSRGKAPHQGGYSAKKKYVANPFKYWFEISDPYTMKIRKVKSTWHPGKSRKK